MNDRFKFRCWDKRRNEFIESPEPTPMLQANGLLAYFKDAEYMNNYDIQFCTGLKDKNGKLIYEGDIVKTDFKFSTVTVNPFLFDIGDVAFSEYFGGWVINSKENPAPYQQARLGKIDAENCEVIGNIYQDSHILEN